jgi:adenosylcobinamide-GDP ribazoletransferase
MDEDGLTQASFYMSFFPLVGGLVGFVAGAVVWLLDVILVLPQAISGILGVGMLLLITGVHHTDGLLDFGDALVFHGPRSMKIRIMHDNQTGAGALALGIIVLTTTALSIASLNPAIVLQSMVASESAAKFTLVLLASTGKSASQGMNRQFVKIGHDKFRWLRLGLSAGFLALLSLPTLGITGVAAVCSSVIAGIAMLGLSDRQFGGVTGDVMGAANDLTRMIALVTIVGASKWL